MSFFSFLRRTRTDKDSRHQNKRRSASAISRATQSESRHEMIRLALRDIQTRQGVPASWLDFDVFWLSKSKTEREPTMHVRLLIKHLEPQLLSNALSFQRSLVKRVSLFDPRASTWLGSVSWQFAVPEDVTSPELRGPGLRPAAAPAPAPEVERQSQVPKAAQVRPGDRSDPAVQQQLEELRKLFAAGDAERALAAAEGEPSGFENTRPFGLTESAR